MASEQAEQAFSLVNILGWLRTGKIMVWDPPSGGVCAPVSRYLYGFHLMVGTYITVVMRQDLHADMVLFWHQQPVPTHPYQRLSLAASNV